MSASLRVVPKPLTPTTGLAKVLNQINKVERTERDIIALLPSLSDDEVIETRNSARILQCCAWKIEIACDAEIWDRSAVNLAKSGKKDTGEKGILAAVNKRAKEIGCGASTVRANARLFRRFAPVLSTEQGLDDKGFYQAALKADDPDAKIEEWIERKLEDPFFRPADAWREVMEAEEAKRPDETSVIDTPEVKQFLEGIRGHLTEARKEVPTNAIFLFEVTDKLIEIIDWQLKRTVEGDCRVIMEAIEETGGADDDGVYTWLWAHGKIMREPQMEKRLLKMIDDKQIIDENAGADGKLDKAKGKQPSWYVPYYVKREKYKPEIEYGDEEEHF